METKKCEVCGQTLPLSAFSKSYKGRCKECVAKQTREKRNDTTLTLYGQNKGVWTFAISQLKNGIVKILAQLRNGLI